MDPQQPRGLRPAEQVRNEYVLQIPGEVRHRPQGTENPDLPTGQVEVLCGELVILNVAQPPPFVIEEDSDVHEDLRLKYRYLDLRRPFMQERLRLRARVISTLRAYLEGQGFAEVETPMLTKSTPEGARDYLVPSRTYPGSFFALPQSPQLFKQLLMVAGLDRYYQVVHCFRDEDLRADRQPEFTQLDIELSFTDEDQIMTLMETMIRELYRQGPGRGAARPFSPPELCRGRGALRQRPSRSAHSPGAGGGGRSHAGRGVQGLRRSRQ